MNEKTPKDAKLAESLHLLASSLKALKGKSDDVILFAATSKAFEISFEYAWKYLKRAADQAGLEVYSPRDAIKAAAQLGLISDIQLWDSFLNARNLSVHDYVGMKNTDFLPLIIQFEKAVRKLVSVHGV